MILADGRGRSSPHPIADAAAAGPQGAHAAAASAAGARPDRAPKTGVQPIYDEDLHARRR